MKQNRLRQFAAAFLTLLLLLPLAPQAEARVFVGLNLGVPVYAPAYPVYPYPPYAYSTYPYYYSTYSSNPYHYAPGYAPPGYVPPPPAYSGYYYPPANR